jgi:sugar lactone lactonase YvrE
MTRIEQVVNIQNQLGEAPMWDPAQQAVYWVDIGEKKILRFHPGSGKLDVWQMVTAITSIGLRAKGGLVVTTEKNFAFFNPQGGSLENISAVEAEKPGARMNDGKVDPQGRFWAGSMTQAPEKTSTLYRMDTDMSVHAMEHNIMVSNGPAWSPDGLIMYFCDTRLWEIYAYDFDSASGAISNKRLFTRLPEGKAKPDGITVDSEGCLWNAVNHGGRLSRYNPQGKLIEEIAIPAEHPTSIIFGGANLDEMYVTTGAMWVAPEERASRTADGGLFRVVSGVRGLPEAMFSG